MTAEGIYWTTAAADCSRSDLRQRYLRTPAVIQKDGTLTKNNLRCPVARMVHFALLFKHWRHRRCFGIINFGRRCLSDGSE